MVPLKQPFHSSISEGAIRWKGQEEKNLQILSQLLPAFQSIFLQRFGRETSAWRR